MAELPPDFAARVRAARSYAGLNQDDFGKLIEVSPTTVGNYEDGTTRPARRSVPETVRLLVNASKLPEWFFTAPRLDRIAPRADTSSDQRTRRIEEGLQELKAEAALRDLEAAARDREALQRIDAIAQAIDRLQTPPQP